MIAAPLHAPTSNACSKMNSVPLPHAPFVDALYKVPAPINIANNDDLIPQSFTCAQCATYMLEILVNVSIKKVVDWNVPLSMELRESSSCPPVLQKSVISWMIQKHCMLYPILISISKSSQLSQQIPPGVEECDEEKELDDWRTQETLQISHC